MIKANRMVLVGVVFLFVFSLSVWAFVPETDKCRWDGYVNYTGDNTSTPAYNLTINGYVNDALNKQYNLSNSSNAYVLTLSGFDGDNVSFRICGFEYANDTFQENGLLNADLLINKSPDGTYGCTCAEVCEGGYCVNPGETTGVCSSNDYYCDSDGNCEAAYGETNVTCEADCLTDGGDGGDGGAGGGGGSAGYSAGAFTNFTAETNESETGLGTEGTNEGGNEEPVITGDTTEEETAGTDTAATTDTETTEEDTLGDVTAAAVMRDILEGKHNPIIGIALIILIVGVGLGLFLKYGRPKKKSGSKK